MIGAPLKLAGHAASLAALRLALPGSAETPGLPKRILILGYSAIGDFIYLLPMIAAVRRKLPDARIVYLANPYPTTREILPASDLVDEVWEFDAACPGPLERLKMRTRIKDARFEGVIVSATAPVGVLGPMIAHIPIRIGHVRPIVTAGPEFPLVKQALWALKRGLVTEEFARRMLFNDPIPVREDKEHTVERNLRLVEGLGLSLAAEDRQRPPLPEPQDAAAWAERRLADAAGAKTVGVHIGSFRSQYAKVWPARKWGEAVRRVSLALGARVYLFGGPEERSNVRRFEHGLRRPFSDLVGDTPILRSFALMKRLDLFLGNDTGLTKAAMALGTPTATVWGPSDRFGWGIYWDKDKHLEVFQVLPCSPCVVMGLRKEGEGVINFSNCGHRKCLAELTSDAVAAAVVAKYADRA